MMSTISSERCLVLRLRASRRKARDAAVAEALGLLRGLRARRSPGGPASDSGNSVWLNVDSHDLDAAISRLKGLGYSSAVDLVTPIEEVRKPRRSTITRWRGREVALVSIWAEPDEELRANSPDRRSFLLECADGVTRRIEGYRGGAGRLQHRALAVEDARLLVNLVSTGAGGRFLDPFAGAGAIIIEARSRGFTTISVDVDPALRFGLAELSDHHVIGNAGALPARDDSFDAIASEPPYDSSALEPVTASIGEAARLIRRGARIAYLVDSTQAESVRKAAESAGLTPELDTRIDRKGTEVVCLCWIRP